MQTLASAEPSWKILPPLPDPIGFGGMFAGVSEGTIFAGGGSRFIDKPIWNGGTKGFGDRIFVLQSPEGPWKELESRLPIAIAHSACAPHGNEVLSAGGVNSSGPLKEAYRIGIENGSVKAAPLPSLPHPIVYGAAAVAGDVLYVVGGVPDPASTQPSNECWALPLTGAQAGWKRVADFPGKAGVVMSAGSDGHNLFVFGGMHYLPSEEGKTRPVPLDNAWRYEPAKGTWTQLEDIPAARVGAASPVVCLPDGDFFLAGGYGFVFPGAHKDHPGFERETFLYSPGSNTWAAGPLLPCERNINPDVPFSPGPEPMVAAPAVIWKGLLVLISGEVRPAIRTPAVVAIPLQDIHKSDP